MASCRLLNYSLWRYLPCWMSVFFLSFIVIGCGTSRKAQNGPASNSTSEGTSKSTSTISDEFASVLDQNRSELDDVYQTQTNEIPAVFRTKASSRNIGNPNQGYRIQLISTRNRARADSVAQDFRTWEKDLSLSYTPKTYIFFRQPYYKVHVGNFQFHDQASKLNQLLKVHFPGAWVVHDSIEPKLVPPDTTRFDQAQR